jgi:DNA-binding NtrC family response regulator
VRVAERQFREDLFFRLSVFPVRIPPLRDRPGDIVILAQHFVDKFSRDVNKSPLLLSTAVLEELQAYPWPGNVRELQNCIERAVILCEAGSIQPRHLNLSFAKAPSAPAAEAAPADPWEAIDLAGTMAAAVARVTQEVERRKLARAMADAGGNKARVADSLQMPYKALLVKLRQYGLAAD